MAKDPVLSPEAVIDLEEIWLYIASQSVRNADSFLDELYNKCIEISELNGIGHIRDDLFPGMLSLAYKRYVIFFVRREEIVEIVRILHGARDIPKVFNQ
jgi:plasmid stabilization system protein ParE